MRRNGFIVFSCRNVLVLASAIGCAMGSGIALAQATITSAAGYTLTYNGNQQAFFSNTWDGTSQQSPTNVALSSQGSTGFGRANDTTSGTFVNDGIYGNNRAWTPSLSGGTSLVGIAFPVAQSLTSIAWGRDNGRNSTATPTGGGDTNGGTSGQFTDRVTGTFTVQFTTVASPDGNTPSGSWTTLGTVALSQTGTSGGFAPWFRHEYDVRTSSGQPIAGVTGVRIFVNWDGSSSNNAPCIDELEVYRTAYWTGGSGVLSSTTSWQTAASGGTTTTPNTGDWLGFAQATSSTQAPTLGGDRTARALSFTTADAVSLTAGGTNRTLTLGWAGDLTTSSTAAISTLAVNSTSGAVTIGSQSAGQQVAVALNASQVWANDSTNLLTVNNGISRVSTDTTSRILTVSGSGNTTLVGALADGGSAGTLGLTKSGAGSLTLTASNAYTGPTTVVSGTLGFVANALSTGTVVLNGGTLRWESGNTQDISSRLTIGSGSAATVDVGANNVTFAGTFGAGSTGSLTKTGAGLLTVTGTAGYTGATTIASGTLQVGNGGTVGAITGDVVNNGALVLNRSDSLGIAGVISGTGAVIQSGAGASVLGGANSFSGGVTVSAGAVTARNASALGTGGVTVAAGGRLQVNTGTNATLANNLTLAGGTVSSFLVALPTGGTYSTTPDGLFGLNTFLSGTGTFAMNGLMGVPVDVLVVGGGGGGGSRFGGGGGAGGVVYQQGVTLAATSAVTVGAGGAGGAASGGAGTSGAGFGASGSNSVLGSYIAYGGGGGGAGDTGNGLSGASGGGAAGRFAGTGGSGTSSQGFSGGSSTGVSPYIGGGGGGAGGTGGAAGTSGAGGIGKLISITGTDLYYGGGGGGGGSADGNRAGGTGGTGGGGAGGNYTGTPAAVSGTANTGGGGGGGAYTGSNQAGAAGGSGLVIVRYSLSSVTNDLVQTLSGSVAVNSASTIDAVRGRAGLRFTGAMSGAGGLTIASSGSGATAKVIFDDLAKSYLGPTVINSGADLRVNTDNSLAMGAVTVNGWLGGSGIVGGAVTVNSGGVLAPGNSIESLQTGTLSFLGGSTYGYEIDSSVSLAIAADFTKILGDLSLSGSVDLALSDLAASPVAFNPGTTFALFNYTGSWNGGLFSVGGSPVANGGSFTVGLNTWRINYNSTTGGSNYASEYTTGSFVNIAIVPEPGAIVLVGIGIAAALALRRRK